MKAIALAKGPKMDQVAALFLFVTQVLRCRLEGVKLYFGSTRHPSDAVDIDCEVTYRKRGKLSATEAVACEFNLLFVPGVLALVQDLNLNNGGTGKKGGWLKGLPFSFTALIRDLVDMGFPVKKVIEWYFRPLTAYFYVQLKRRAGKLEFREGWEEFTKILPETGNSHHALTLNGYCQNLWELGLDKRTIALEALFWSQKFQGAKEWKLSAREGAQRTKKRYYPLGNKRMVSVSTRHPRLPGQLFRHNTVIVINHNPDDGTVVVLTRLPHGSLDELRRHLPGWHLERRYQYPMLLHGSQSRDQKGYWKNPDMLVELIRQYVQVVD